jgi:hypothetical protein
MNTIEINIKNFSWPILSQLSGPGFAVSNTYVPCFVIYIFQPKNFCDLNFMLLLVRTQQGFENIGINKRKNGFSSIRYLSLFPFSSSHPLSLPSYILSHLFMIAGCRVGGLTYLHLHLYPHMMNPTDRCSFPYLVNFMVAVVEVGAYELTFSSSRPLSLSGYILSHLSMISGSRVGGMTSSSPSISSHDESDRPLFLSILSQFYGRSCRVSAYELGCLLFCDIHIALKTSMIYNSTAGSSYTLTSFNVSFVAFHPHQLHVLPNID